LFNYLNQLVFFSRCSVLHKPEDVQTYFHYRIVKLNSSSSSSSSLSSSSLSSSSSSSLSSSSSSSSESVAAGGEVFTYNVGSDPTVSWTNSSNAFDSDPDTFSDRLIDKSTKETTKFLVGTNANAYVIGSTTITQVRIGVKARFSPAADIVGWLVPVFWAGLPAQVVGSEYSFTNDGTAGISWVDITNDPNAPSPWTWAGTGNGPDVASVDVRFFCEEINGNLAAAEAYEIYIEVTHA
jgi:hypothetical protein